MEISGWEVQSVFEQRTEEMDKRTSLASSLTCAERKVRHSGSGSEINEFNNRRVTSKGLHLRVYTGRFTLESLQSDHRESFFGTVDLRRCLQLDGHCYSKT